MKRYGRMALCLILWGMIWTLLSGALAETGRIVTPKGPANMRKRAEDKAPLVESVPNKTLVEIEEWGEEWSKIVYKKQTGYVKSEFLRAPSQLVGKTAYPDGGTVLLRKEADAASPVIAVLGCAEKAEIVGLEGDWLILEKDGKRGYTESVGFSYQLQEPAGEMEWITEAALCQEDTEIKAEPKGDETVGALQKGQQYAVTVIQGEYCLVVTEDGCGWAPVSALRLLAPDTWDAAEGVTPNEASRAAGEKLTKQYKAYAKERLYATCSVWEEKDGYPGPLYQIYFLNDQDQYLYGALVKAETGDVVFSSRYEGFALPVQEERELLPDGEIRLTLSAKELKIGDVLDAQVDAWTLEGVRYDLFRGGQQIVKGEATDHFAASYRPLEAGDYTLRVTVKDQAGKEASAEETFAVVSEYVVSETEETGKTFYSQKDGWWKDKKYRHSNLEKSGCAIFALAHGLNELGFSGPETFPENLAVKYAQFLIPEEGTSNERLINKAAQDFGFKSRTALYTEPKQIVGLFEGGAVFSFSPARGHIALADGVSEEGDMVHVVDSAPGATFERIKDVSLYYRMRSGAFRAALTLEDLPGAKWYFATGEYGALEYYMPMDYIAKRGVRLIQPLTPEEEAGK